MMEDKTSRSAVNRFDLLCMTSVTGMWSVTFKKKSNYFHQGVVLAQNNMQADIIVIKHMVYYKLPHIQENRFRTQFESLSLLGEIKYY